MGFQDLNDGPGKSGNQYSRICPGQLNALMPYLSIAKNNKFFRGESR